jgi:tRNA G10  N-methylase Trm11
MGLKPGETILDPMMGSGTVLIEVQLMGIISIADCGQRSALNWIAN